VAQAIRDIGAFAGLGAFLGLAILSLLYISQARDVRRLREWAGRAPERDAQEVEATSDLAAERAEELRKVDEERARREEAVAAERQSAEHRESRRQRREAGLPEETRWERIRGRFSRTPSSTRRLPEPRYIAVIVAAVIVLGAGVAVAATQLIGSNGDGKSSKGSVLKPSQIQVDVLNGTNPPVNGLAGLVSDKLESAGYHTGHVGNSHSSFATSEVMFKRGFRPEAARLARKLKIHQVRLLSNDIRSDTKTGNPVAVVVGQDKANFSG
jgi:LytR cell envelope-related transcriptional attenuator